MPRLALRSQLLFVGFDHLLDHLAAYRARLTGSQITVIAFFEVYTDLCRSNIALKSAVYPTGA